MVGGKAWITPPFVIYLIHEAFVSSHTLQFDYNLPDIKLILLKRIESLFEDKFVFLLHGKQTRSAEDELSSCSWLFLEVVPFWSLHLRFQVSPGISPCQFVFVL